MPKVESAHDLAAKDGVISSHRWLGANTITPLFYGQTEQARLTEEFLRDNVLSVDIFALRDAAAGRTFAPLDPGAENPVPLRAGEEVTAEVVVFNRKAAHSFPPELRDLYEPWVEFEAVDDAGRTVFHSGFVRADQTLDESAHVYKSILLDEEARPLTRHQVWLGKIKAYDNFVPQGRGDVVRYRFRIPADAKEGAFTSVTLRARVNYRRFIQEYTDYVLRLYNARLSVPVVRMAEAEVKLVASDAPVGKAKAGGQSVERQERRWNDYGIGLMEQAQYGPAAEAFRRASESAPQDPDPLVSAAVAEFKTERYGPEREQLRKAAALLEAALKLSPKLARARFYHALVLRSEGDARRAAEELAAVAAEYPRDREVQRQLGQTLYGLGRIAEARAAFEAVLRIDPNDAGAYQFLSPIYAGEGREAEAARARSLYLLWRDDPVADAVAVRFFTSHPEWADERVWSHAHGAGSPLRPTLTGGFAASDR
jgi:Flp pilus assembly protein TadD